MIRTAVIKGKTKWKNTYFLSFMNDNLLSNKCPRECKNFVNSTVHIDLMIHVRYNLTGRDTECSYLEGK